MNLDRSFMLFIQAGKGSILPSLLMASQEWHLQKQQAGVTCPLRQVLFLKMVEELVQRALQIENKEDALCTSLRSKLILTEGNAWNYMAWDASAKCLRPTKQEPLPGDRIREILTLLTRLGAHTELIHRFSPLRPLDKNGIPEDSQLTIPWRLDISREQPALWGLDGSLRQRHWPDDPASHTASNTAEIPIGPSSGPQSQTLAHRLLEHAFHNGGNTCFQNSVMLCQLWATIVLEDLPLTGGVLGVGTYKGF